MSENSGWVCSYSTVPRDSTSTRFRTEAKIIGKGKEKRKKGEREHHRIFLCLRGVERKKIKFKKKKKSTVLNSSKESRPHPFSTSSNNLHHLRWGKNVTNTQPHNFTFSLHPSSRPPETSQRPSLYHYLTLTNKIMHTLQLLPLHARQPFTPRIRLPQIHIAIGELEGAFSMLRHERDP